MARNPRFYVDSYGDGLTLSAAWERELSARARQVYRAFVRLFHGEIEGNSLNELARETSLSPYGFLMGAKELQSAGLISGLPDGEG